MKWSQLVGEIIEIAEGAGAETLKHYRSATLGVDHKSDASPVTAADLAAHHYIVDRLEPVLEGVEVISEESAEARRDLQRPPKTSSGWSTPWTAPRNSSTSATSSLSTSP